MKWEPLTVKDVANVESGFGFPRQFQGEKGSEFPFFKVGDMNLPGNEVEMNVASNTVSASALRKLKARTFPAGAIIFPKIGAAIATNKKRILSTPATVDNNVMALIPKPGTYPKFLYYWSLTFDLRSVSNIGPVPSIRKTEIEKTPFFRPLFSEQRRIVEILDQAEALRKKRAEADAKAAQILPALFHKMFGDPFGKPMGWKQTPLGEMLPKKSGALQSGPFGSQLHNHDFVADGTVLAVGVDNVHDTGFEWGRGRRITDVVFHIKLTDFC